MKVTEEELFEQVFEHGMQKFDMIGKVTPKERVFTPRDAVVCEKEKQK